MQTTLIILGILVATFFIARSIALNKLKNTPLIADHDNVLMLTDQNFQQEIRNKVVLVDFWAGWCAPSRMMAPILNEVAAELNGNLRVGKVDVERYQSLAGKYNVRSIPTLILFNNGKEINRYVGIKSKDFLIREIAKVSSVTVN